MAIITAPLSSRKIDSTSARRDEINETAGHTTRHARSRLLFEYLKFQLTNRRAKQSAGVAPSRIIACRVRCGFTERFTLSHRFFALPGHD